MFPRQKGRSMNERKQTEHFARAVPRTRKSADPSASAMRTEQSLARLCEEHDYLEIKVSRQLQAVPCDLVRLAALLRELAAIEQDIVRYKNRAMKARLRS